VKLTRFKLSTFTILYRLYIVTLNLVENDYI